MSRCLMDSRKRDNLLSADSAAKIQRRCGDETGSCGSNDIQSPLQMEVSDEVESPHIEGDTERQTFKRAGKRRKKRKTTVTKKAKPVEALPPAELSLDVLSSLHTVPGPTDDVVYYTLSISILHPYMFNKNEVYQILQSRDVTTGGKEDECDLVNGSGVSFIGVLTCELEHDLNLTGIFRDGGESVQLSLVLDESTTIGRWLIRVKVGVNSSHLLVKVDPRLASISYKELTGMFVSASSLVKLFLFHDINEDSSNVKSLQFELWATEKITNFNNPSDPSSTSFYKRNCEKVIHNLVELLYPKYNREDQNGFTHGSNQVPSIITNSSIVAQVEQFYKNIQLQKTKTASPCVLLIPGLLAKLRGYQCEAVSWMLEREGVTGSGAENHTSLLHVLWRQLPMKEPQVYFSPYTARFSSVFFPKKPWPKGGILADEMGLGKTVEMLALILAHKWPNLHVLESSAAMIPPDNSHTSTDRDGPKPAPLALDEGDKIFCLCGAIEALPEDRLVQCERCLRWQHIKCSGYSEEHGDVFICTNCLLIEPYRCKTTLIVCPEAIFIQWKEEIEKHTNHGALNVMMYPGIAKQYVSPLMLGSCDVVLASYEMLRSELYHVTSREFYKKLRHPKRFGCLPSPLPAVYWWRICLDEAQMVESTTVKAAEMMQRLSAVNRWCVTGTPVQKDLRDLYGLLMFLGTDPYHVHQWYQRLLWRPLIEGNDIPMLSLFSNLMWRNSKEDVATELQLPEQTEKIHWVTFSSVEEYFYRRQQETCLARMTDTSRNTADTALSSMHQSTLNKFLTPLHSLRQTCCTPQIVRTGYLPQDLSKIPITMEVLLNKLTQQAKVEARDALRQLVSTLNGLAGLHTLANELSAAVGCYREVISLWQDYKERDVDCDKLQRIHTLENLASLLKDGSVSREAGHSLMDDSLMKEAENLRSDYSRKADDNFRAAMNILKSHKTGVHLALKKSRVSVYRALGQDMEEESSSHHDVNASSPLASPQRDSQGGSGPPGDFQGGSGPRGDSSSPQPQDVGTRTEESAPNISSSREASTAPRETLREVSTPPREDAAPFWWDILGNWCSKTSKDSNLLDRIQLEISSNPDHASTPHLSIGGLGLFLNLKISSIEESRAEVWNTMLALSVTPSLEQVERAAECHMIGPSHQRPELCECCMAERTSVKYESDLFSRCSSLSLQAEHGEGSRFPSLFERIIKCMLSFSKRNGAPKGIVNAGQCCVEYIESLKREYPAIRSLWMCLEQRLGVHHELQQASTKLRLFTDYEMLHNYPSCPQAVHESDIPIQVESMELDKEDHLSKLKKCVGQVIYLKTLEKKETNKDLCPICTTEMGKKWGVFPCGHSLCLECTDTLVKRRNGASNVVRLPCPLCREICLSSEINFVKLGAENSVHEDTEEDGEKEEEQISVKGDHASKILAVTETLMRIQRSNPGAKSLVFSSWLEVLGHISESLQENLIPHHILKSKSSFQTRLTSFKNSPTINVLLLPFQSGSKGLNIVEATHVLLVEPLLNVGAELQAIGRVHRMGQTRSTTIHRFIVRKTVEERMHTLLHDNQQDTPSRHAFVEDFTSNLTCGEVRNLMLYISEQ